MSIQLESALEELGVEVLSANKTVNLNSSMSASEIQALIDAQPKNLGGYTLTFQFADGTYTLDSQLYFSYFYNGVLRVYGNRVSEDENTLHSNQSVHLDSSAQYCLNFYQVSARSYVHNLKCEIDDVANYYCVYFNTCSGYLYVHGCYLLGSGDVNVTHGIRQAGGEGLVQATYVSDVKFGIYSSNGCALFSNGNDDIGTSPSYGLYALSSGIIGKISTQPSGSVSNELTNSGGVIR